MLSLPQNINHYQMAGLYIHVPFCTKRCIYCDFFSNTEMKYKSSYVESVIKEMALRKDYIEGEEIETIYFGGGTPSLLSATDFRDLFEAIQQTFIIKEKAEITLEANPDDITESSVKNLCKLPFNRVIMGVQSFNDNDLHFLNRRHDSREAHQAIKLWKENDIHNISIDLIYGLPGQTIEAWIANINEALTLDIPHISAYMLTYEKGTPLYRMLQAGKIKPADDDLSLAFFSTLIKMLTTAGFTHYEISNFARQEFFSQHNSSYWTGKKYLGLGPAAHSYNGKNRQWNVASLPKYIEGIKNNKPITNGEILNLFTCYNDYIVTRMRTRWGIKLSDLQKLFGDNLKNYFLKTAQPYIKEQFLIQNEDTIKLSERGTFISDGIMSDLMYVD